MIWNIQRTGTGTGDAVSDIKCDAESDVMSYEMSNAVTYVDIVSDKRHCLFWNITLWKMKKKMFEYLHLLLLRDIQWSKF